jgi:hypothetical protein
MSAGTEGPAQPRSGEARAFRARAFGQENCMHQEDGASGSFSSRPHACLRVRPSRMWKWRRRRRKHCARAGGMTATATARVSQSSGTGSRQRSRGETPRHSRRYWTRATHCRAPPPTCHVGHPGRRYWLGNVSRTVIPVVPVLEGGALSRPAARASASAHRGRPIVRQAEVARQPLVQSPRPYPDLHR